MRRRSWLLGVGAAALSERARALGPSWGRRRTLAEPVPPSGHLVEHVVRVDGDPRIADRAALLVPAGWPRERPLPTLVLLHGLGEMGDPALGLRAWPELYGARACHERLWAPPIERVAPRMSWLDDERRARLEASLARRPYRGLALLCPVTPNPSDVPPRERTLDRFAEWLTLGLLPAVEDLVPATAGAPRGLDGCSLGGKVALEVLLRAPAAFRTFGVIQGALRGAPGAALTRSAARVLAPRSSAPRTSVSVITSTEDPFLEGCRALHAELVASGVDATLSVPRGPHTQPWLREVGTLELLFWHERRLTSALDR